MADGFYRHCRLERADEGGTHWMNAWILGRFARRGQKIVVGDEEWTVRSVFREPPRPESEVERLGTSHEADYVEAAEGGGE